MGDFVGFFSVVFNYSRVKCSVKQELPVAAVEVCELRDSDQEKGLRHSSTSSGSGQLHRRKQQPLVCLPSL